MKKLDSKNSMLNIIDKSMIIKIIIVIVVFLLFYLLTLLIVHNDNKTSKESDVNEKTDSKTYNEIILGRSLSMSDDDYLVLCFDASIEENVNYYSVLIKNYSLSNDINAYVVDLNSAFNKKYVTDEESNKNPESVSDMKINGPTLMKISANKVVSYIEGKDNISSYLGE